MKVTTLHSRRVSARVDAEDSTMSGLPMQIAVIGAGRIGLVNAACLARLGHRVVALDVDGSKIAALENGEAPFHEPGLPELVAEQVAQGRLSFSADFASSLRGAELIFIAVGTTEGADGATVMSAVDEAMEQVASHADAASVVAIRSTVPVGTARSLQAALDSRTPKAPQPQAPSLRVLSNPDFVRDGSAVSDFLTPDRIVIGCDFEAEGQDDGAANSLSEDDFRERDTRSSIALNRLRRAYQSLIAAGAPVLVMDTRSAELAKCAANAMLAARVSFINEIAAIADATGADIERVCAGIGSDHRIGDAFLGAGLGYGGSSLPKDVAMLRHMARQHHLRADMLTAIERVNSRQHCWPAHAIARSMGGWGALRGMRAAVWGLAFKPGSDDMRHAPSITLLERLRRVGVRLAVYDPAAMANARDVLGADRHLRWCDSAADALDDADTLLLLTEWPEFVSFAPEEAALALRPNAIVFDARNVLDIARWQRTGLRLVQVGRPSADVATQLDDSVIRWDDDHIGGRMARAAASVT